MEAPARSLEARLQVEIGGEVVEFGGEVGGGIWRRRRNPDIPKKASGEQLLMYLAHFVAGVRVPALN